MRLSRDLVVGAAIAALALGCGDKKQESDGDGDGAKAGSASPAAEPPRVVFGDCGAGSSRFESGPRPVRGPDVIGDEAALDRIAGVDSPKPAVRSKDQDQIDEAIQGGIIGVLTQDTSALSGGNVYGGLLGAEVGELRGGWGYGISGVGPGGDHTGWGTINTTRSGAIGHLGRRRPPASSVLVRIGRASVTGDLDKHIIRRYIRRKMRAIRDCYEEALKAKPDLAGKLAVHFEIGPTGRVRHLTAKGLDPKVAACVARVIETVRFPNPKGGGLVKVSYPFTFISRNSRREKGEESAAVLGKMAIATPDKRLARPKPYIAEAKSPLAKIEGAIAKCASEAPDKHGVAVVELTAGADGALTSTAAIGGGDALNQCLAAAAKTVTLVASERPERSYRCPLAYGELPAGEARGIGITDKSVRLDGKEIARLADIERGPRSRVEALSEALAAKFRAQRDDKDSVVAITGPVVIRPVETTKMAVLMGVYTTARRTVGDGVLAAKRGDRWELLRDGITLPVAPVRRSTGGAWQPGSGFGGGLIGRPAAIAVLVTADKILVGYTGGEPISIAGRDLAVLGVRLAEIKKRPAFANSGAIQISGADDVTYDAIVGAIDEVKRRGFERWSLVHHERLAVKLGGE